jgi:hypothetical protein
MAMTTTPRHYYMYQLIQYQWTISIDIESCARSGMASADESAIAMGWQASVALHMQQPGPIGR